jgi:hypothetical protein
MASPSIGKARAETSDAEMARNVMMDPKFFMVNDWKNKRQARRNIWMKERKRYGAQLFAISQANENPYSVPTYLCEIIQMACTLKNGEVDEKRITLCGTLDLIPDKTSLGHGIF